MRYLLMFLGNPGSKYVDTRHNVGFSFLDFLKKKYNLSLLKQNNIYTVYKQENFLFLQTFSGINLSGENLRIFLNDLKEEINLITFYDDVNLNLPVFKLTFKRHSGGHNGIKSLLHNYDKKILRCRIGIGPQTIKDLDIFVLNKFSKEQ